MINHGTSWCFQSVSCVFLPLESDHFPHRIWQIWESWSIFPPRDVFLLVRFSAEEDLRRLTFGTYQSWVQVVQSGFSYHSSCCQAENLKVKIEHPCQVGVFCLSSGQGEAVWSHGYSWCYLMNLFSLLGTSWSYNQSFPAVWGAFWRRKWELGQANSFGIEERLGLSAQRWSSWDVVMDVIISPTYGVWIKYIVLVT